MNAKLKNEIDILKRNHKNKLEEIQKLLDLDFDPDGLINTKLNETGTRASQMARQHKEMIEKAEVLLRSNKEMEKQIKEKELMLEELISE